MQYSNENSAFGCSEMHKKNDVYLLVDVGYEPCHPQTARTKHLAIVICLPSWDKLVFSAIRAANMRDI